MNQFTLSPSKLQFSYDKYTMNETDIMNDLFDFNPPSIDSYGMRQNTSNLAGTNSNKRSYTEDKTLASEDEYSTSVQDRRYESSSNKKRFMWSDSLHRDFILAVYDIGLKTVSTKSIRDFASANNFSDVPLSNEQIKSFVVNQRKYHNYRKSGEISQTEYISRNNDYLYSSTNNTTPNYVMVSNTSEANSYIFKDSNTMHNTTSYEATQNEALEDRLKYDKARVEAVNCLKGQLDYVTKKINNQANYIRSMNNHIEKQQRIQINLKEKVSALENINFSSTDSISVVEFTTNDLNSKISINNSETTNIINSNKISSSNNAIRSNMSIESLRIFNEMQHNMEIHKKLFLRREDLLNQHPSIDNEAISSSSGSGIRLPLAPSSYHINNLKSSQQLLEGSMMDRVHGESSAKWTTNLQLNSALSMTSPVRSRQDPVLSGINDWPVEGFDSLDENLFSFLLE